MRWERVQIQQEGEGHGGPGKRWGHTCNSIKGGRFLYVFGGYGKDNCQTNQVHVFDTAKNTWSQPVIKGTPPAPRDSHSCTTIGDNLCVFGGTDGFNPLQDLHILDTSSHTWVSPSLRGDGPEAREGHSAADVGKRLFIFGGCGKSSVTNEEVYYNDVYILNTETFVWKRAITSGTPPSARDSHTCCSWKNKIFVIGGEDGNDYYLSDVHILDAETLVWKELNTSGQKLPPRAGHSTVALGKSLFVFGGFTDAQNLYDDLHMLDIDTGIWTKVMTTGNGPSARFSASGDCLDPMKGGVLMFIGGCNKALEALEDMYFLHTGLVGVRAEQQPEKLSLRKQLKLKCQEQILHFPAYDKSLVRIDTSPQLHQAIPSYSQPIRETFQVNQSQPHQAKKTFQAKVTEAFPNGYTIETCIDGKPLRGILFANKPAAPPIVNLRNSRKRANAEIGGVFLNGSYDKESKAPVTDKQDAADHVRVDGVLVKESISQDAKMQESAVPGKQNVTTSNASHPHEVTTNPKQAAVTSLNLNLRTTGDGPTSGTEDQKEISETVKGSTSLAVVQDGGMLVDEAQNDPVRSV